MPARDRQLSLELANRGRGGARVGAGQRAMRGAKVLHRARDRVPPGCPVLVTIKLAAGLPSLRSRRFVRAFRYALRECAMRPGLRIVHYSVQSNHCHFLIEATGKTALGNGMKSLSARLARTVNRVFSRSGAVLHGRYHSRILRSPREARGALAYVLLNHRRHTRRPGPPAIDPASSGAWFDGWKDGPPDHPGRLREVAVPGSWLLREGWRRHRLIHLSEVPGPER